MPDSRRRLILGNGEQYVLPVTKPLGGRAPEPPRTYAEARDRIRAGVQASLSHFAGLPQRKKLTDEAVFCLRLHPDATAKSYDPVALFEDVPELKKIGSRNYRARVEDVAETRRTERQRLADATEVQARLVFVQSSRAGFARFVRQLDRAETQVRQQVRQEIRRIERFDTLSVEEQILGFDSKWKGGRAELIFHPSRASEDRQLTFYAELFDEAGIDSQRSRIRLYPGGPTFISCRLNRHSLAALGQTNPLRAAHPLSFGGLTDLRSAPTAKAPKPPASPTRSTIKVGMFDGGVDPTVELLQGHVEEDTALGIGTAPQSDCIAHGTAVAGALLYGELNGIAPGSRLLAPPVYVVSIRSLPTSDPADVDLYEAIDVVEQAVPARKDIKIFNVSFGPRGPILDDTLSRFTWVLDSLAFAHKVAFFVAVGNDGEVAGFDRIQAPSDAVHGIGVGAYTLAGSEAVVAPYSCRGPGCVRHAILITCSTPS